jgi:hypothetical protein
MRACGLSVPTAVLTAVLLCYGMLYDVLNVSNHSIFTFIT